MRNTSNLSGFGTITTVITPSRIRFLTLLGFLLIGTFPATMLNAQSGPTESKDATTPARNQVQSSARHAEGDQRAGASPEKSPALTSDQKNEILRAQVALYQAKEVLESTPQFQAFQRAQSNLNETALRVQREAKVDPAKWTLGQDLNYVAVPQKPAEKK